MPDPPIGQAIFGRNPWSITYDSHDNFEYRKQDIVEEMKKSGNLPKNYIESSRLQKKSSGLYLATDWQDYPAYEVKIEIPTTQNPSEKVKITATRIPIDPKIKDEHEKLP